MHFNSDIHTVTYLSKNMEFAGLTLSGLQRLVRFCWSVVNSGREGGYYVGLIGIKGLNWLSKHFINREWIAVRERFIGAVDQWYLDVRRGGCSEFQSWFVPGRCRQEIQNELCSELKQLIDWSKITLNYFW